MRHRVFIEFDGISHNFLTNYRGTKNNFTKRSLDNTPIIKQSNCAPSVTDWNLVPPDRQWWEFLLKMLKSEWVQLLIRVWFYAIPWTAARQASLSSTNFRSSNSCPSSQWCHPAILSSVVSFSSHLQSFPASGSFSVNQFFTSSGQSIGISALASVLPINIQDLFPSWQTGWISSQSKGLSRVFSNTTVQKRQFFRAQLSL